MKISLFVIFFVPWVALGQSKLDTKIFEESKLLTCLLPSEENPVTIASQLVAEGDSMAVIIKTAMAPGWHIYAYVPPEYPYIVMDLVLRLPEHLSAVGPWVKTKPAASSDDPGVLIYEGDALFIHKVFRKRGSGGGTIKTGLYYQTCNLRQCLPPKEELFSISY